MLLQLWNRHIPVIRHGVALGYSETSLSIPAGIERQHVSSCQAQLLASEVIPWVGGACSVWMQHNSWGELINWVMTVAQPC